MDLIVGKCQSLHNDSRMKLLTMKPSKRTINHTVMGKSVDIPVYLSNKAENTCKMLKWIKEKIALTSPENEK